VLEGDPHALDEGLGWVVSKEPVRVAHRADGLTAVVLLQAVDEAREDLVLGAQVRLLGRRLAARPPPVVALMLRQSDPLPGSEGQLDMLGDEGVAIEDADLIDGLSDSQAAAEQVLAHRDGVPVRVQIDVALDVHPPLMEVVDVRDMEREASQRGLLGDPKGSRRSTQVPAKPEIGAVAPGPKLAIEIAKVVERPTRVEIVLDVVEGAFHATRAIGMPDRVGLELEAEALRQRQHGIRGNRVLARAMGDDDRAVVDDAAPRAALEVLEGLAEEGAALEPSPPQVNLSIEQTAMAEDEAGAL
jgi:hypothetical protein